MVPLAYSGAGRKISGAIFLAEFTPFLGEFYGGGSHRRTLPLSTATSARSRGDFSLSGNRPCERPTPAGLVAKRPRTPREPVEIFVEARMIVFLIFYYANKQAAIARHAFLNHAFEGGCRDAWRRHDAVIRAVYPV